MCIRDRHITYHVLFDEYGQPDHAIGFGEDVNEVYANKIRIQQEQYYEAIMYGSRLYYDINPVSYTHLDVYKRQPYNNRPYWIF